MRHQNSGRKFDRNSSSRRAMFRNLASNLVLHERVHTTDAKAKELRGIVERLVTKARRLGEVAFAPQESLSAADKLRRSHAVKLVGSYLNRKVIRTTAKDAFIEVDLVDKVFTDLAKRFKDRPGGYTRIVKLGHRRGDGAKLALIEWVATDKPAQV